VRILAAFAACAALAQTPAQTPAPAGLIRGDLLEWEATRGAGEFSIRTATHQVYRFSFDSRTYVERDRERTTVDKLAKGDLVEIVSDKAPGAMLTYARTVHVIDRQPPRRALLSQGRYRASRGVVYDRIVPLGDLTFSGIVARINGGRLLLRTRRDGEKTILLRQDTNYIAGGVQVALSALQPNTRVFIRGTRNLDDDVEAYQVVWGDILEPAP